MLISVQALRARAAWTVVGHHFMQIFFGFQADTALGQLFVDKGAVGVDVFFVISGLVIFLSTENKQLPPWRFLLYRLLRIVPAYWFYTVLMALLVVFARPVLPDQSVDAPHVLMSLLFIPTENPGGYGVYPTLNVGWTLNYEMLFYVLFAWALLFRRQWRLLVVAALLFAVCQAWTSFGWISDFYRSDIVCEFLLGIGIGMLYRKGWIRPGLRLPLLGNRGSAAGDLSLAGVDECLNVGTAECGAGHRLQSAGAFFRAQPVTQGDGGLFLRGVPDARIGAVCRLFCRAALRNQRLRHAWRVCSANRARVHGELSMAGKR